MKLAGELNFLPDLVNEISVVKILARQYYLLNENVHPQNTKTKNFFNVTGTRGQLINNRSV